MKKLLVMFGVLALAFAGCVTSVDSDADDAVMDDAAVVEDDAAMGDDEMVEDVVVEEDAMTDEVAE